MSACSPPEGQVGPRVDAKLAGKNPVNEATDNNSNVSKKGDENEKVETPRQKEQGDSDPPLAKETEEQEIPSKNETPGTNKDTIQTDGKLEEHKRKDNDKANPGKHKKHKEETSEKPGAAKRAQEDLKGAEKPDHNETAEQHKSKVTAQVKEERTLTAREQEKAKVTAQVKDEPKVTAQELEKAKVTAQVKEVPKVTAQVKEEPKVTAQEQEKTKETSQERPKETSHDQEESKMPSQDKSKVTAQVEEKLNVRVPELEKSKSTSQEQEKSIGTTQVQEKPKSTSPDLEKSNVVSQDQEITKQTTLEVEKSITSVQEQSQVSLAVEEPTFGIKPPKWKPKKQEPQTNLVPNLANLLPPVQKEPETAQGWLELCEKEWGLQKKAIALPDHANWKDIYKRKPFGRNFLKCPNPEGLSTTQPPPQEVFDPPPEKKPLETLGNFSGWQISSEEIPVDRSNIPPGVVVCYLPVYSWCVKEQLLDLCSEGLWPELLDSYQPDIYVLDWYEDSKLHKQVYELHVKLLAEDKKTILAQLDLTPENDMSGEPKGWNAVSHIFKSYGPGLRYVHFLHKSKDLSVLGFHRTRVADSTLFAQLRD